MSGERVMRSSVVGVPTCDECPPITFSVLGAGASVGIEYGRSMFHELALYLEAKHAEHVGLPG